MSPGARRVCGVEWAGGRLIVVQRAGRRVVRAAVLEPGEADADLGIALRRAGFAPGAVHVVGSDPELTHQVVALPPMSAGERRLFLEREAAREAGAARAVGSQLLRRATGPGGKDEVLTVSAPAETVQGLLAPCGRAVPALVTTGPLALVAAVEALAPVAGPSALLHVGAWGLTIAVVADGRLGAARQVHRPAGASLDPLEWAGAEIQRSIRHHAMTSKGQAVVQLVCASDDDEVGRALCGPDGLGRRLGLPVVNLDDALRAVVGAAAASEVAAGALALAFGGAVLDARRAANLLPAPLVDARRAALIVRRAIAAGLVIALGTGGGLAWTGWQMRALRAEQARLAQARQARDEAARAAAAIAAERQAAGDRLHLLRDDPLASPPLAEALREVSRVAPDALRLDRLLIERDGRGYGLTLSGLMADADLAVAQRDFNRLYFGLRTSPLFHSPTFTRHTAGDAGASAASTSTASRFVFEVGVRFTEVRR